MTPGCSEEQHAHARIVIRYHPILCHSPPWPFPAAVMSVSMGLLFFQIDIPYPEVLRGEGQAVAERRWHGVAWHGMTQLGMRRTAAGLAHAPHPQPNRCTLPILRCRRPGGAQPEPVGHPHRMRPAGGDHNVRLAGRLFGPRTKPAVHRLHGGCLGMPLCAKLCSR